MENIEPSQRDVQPMVRKPWQAPQVIMSDADDTDAKLILYVEATLTSGTTAGPVS